MNLSFTLLGHEIVVTTEHSTSSYGIPVVLVDGDARFQVEGWEGAAPTPALETLIDESPDWAAVYALHRLGGGHNGPATMRALENLWKELDTTPQAVVDEFRRRGAKDEA